MAMSEGATNLALPSPLRVPGDPGVWVLVLGDLCVFALFFATFAYYRIAEPDIFHRAQQTLDQTFGLINTLFLLTSSLCVVRGLGATRAGDRITAPRWISAAIMFGLAFGVVKAIEYSRKVADGLMPGTNDFYMLYFVFTGIHLVHVIVGVIVLLLMRSAASRGVAGPSSHLFESGAIFWHMVDVLWVILFAIFYLHR